MKTCFGVGAPVACLLLIGYGCTGERTSGEPKRPTDSSTSTSTAASTAASQGTLTKQDVRAATATGDEKAAKSGATGGKQASPSPTRGANPAVRCSLGNAGTGIWKKISPPKFVDPPNMESMAVAVNPLDGTVYAAAGNVTNGGHEGTGVYRSSNCGQSFELISKGAGAQNLFTGNPWVLRIDPVEPNIMYINNGYGNEPTIYRSRDGGVDFTALYPAPASVVRNFSQAISLDPNNPKHLIMSYHLTCKGGHSPVCLVRSKNGGDTWEIIDGPSELPGWQEAASVGILGPDSYVYTGRGVWFTSDSGKSWSQVMQHTMFGSYGGGTHKASDGRYYLPGGRGGGASGQVSIAEGNPLGSSWRQLKAPPTGVIVDDGEHLIASFAYLKKNVFNWAPLDAPENWTAMPDEGCERGANMLAYDPVHRVVYSANWTAGLWRFVLERR